MNLVKGVSKLDILIKPLFMEIVDFTGRKCKGFFRSLALYKRDVDEKDRKDSFDYIYEVFLILCGAGRIDMRYVEAWAKEKNIEIESVVVYDSEDIEIRVQPSRGPFDPITKEVVLSIKRRMEEPS